MTDLDILFTPTPIGERTAINRFVAQPMETSEAEPDGAPSETTLARYRRLAEGQWGVVFLEAASVTTTSIGRLRGLVLTEAHAARYEALARGFKQRCPNGLLLAQITHSGPNTHPSSDRVTVCPQPQPGLRYLAADEIERIRQQFVAAALLAEKIGFDGIDYKLCNGYLGAELIRPSNTRPDRWGGSFENRARFLVEGCQEIIARRRSRAFLVGSRFNFSERRAGGFGKRGPESREYDPAEPFELLRLMDRLGMDYVNITGDVADLSGYPDATDEERLVTTLLAERLTSDLVKREGLRLAVMSGGYSAFGRQAAPLAARRLRAGYTDFIGYGRQTFADPLTPAKLLAGEPVNDCVGCNACMKLMLGQYRAGCAAYDPPYRALFKEYRRNRQSKGL